MKEHWVGLVRAERKERKMKFGKSKDPLVAVRAAGIDHVACLRAVPIILRVCT